MPWAVPTPTARESTPVCSTNAAASSGSVRKAPASARSSSFPPTRPSSASRGMPPHRARALRVRAIFCGSGSREPSIITEE